MAYIRKLPSGRFQACVVHPSGRKQYKTDAIKRVVAAWAAEQETWFRVGNVAAETGRRVTVAAWCERWQRTRQIEPETAAKHRKRLERHVLPHWGTWPLSTIGRLDVTAWVKALDDAGVGPHELRASYAVFSRMMSDAELEGLIPATPCRKIRLPKAPRPAPRWLTRHEYDRLLMALADEPNGRVWQALVAVACFTGLRPGETSGLDVGKVDFDRHQIRVDQVLTAGGLRQYPKTDASLRTVPFPNEVADLLWPVVADKPDDAPVFQTVTGRRVEQANWNNLIWRPALKRAGISHVRPYVTRHTASSWLVQAGVPLWDIAQLLGHTTTSLVSVYAHLAPDAHDRVRAAWNAGGAGKALADFDGSPDVAIGAGQGGR